MQQLLDASVRLYPEKSVLEEAGEKRSAIESSANSPTPFAIDCVTSGWVRPIGVGIYLRKSIDAVAAIFGIMKAGAAYVPVDPGSHRKERLYKERLYIE